MAYSPPASVIASTSHRVVSARPPGMTSGNVRLVVLDFHGGGDQGRVSIFRQILCSAGPTACRTSAPTGYRMGGRKASNDNSDFARLASPRSCPACNRRETPTFPAALRPLSKSIRPPRLWQPAPPHPHRSVSPVSQPPYGALKFHGNPKKCRVAVPPLTHAFLTACVNKRFSPTAPA